MHVKHVCCQVGYKCSHLGIREQDSAIGLTDVDEVKAFDTNSNMAPQYLPALTPLLYMYTHRMLMPLAVIH